MRRLALDGGPVALERLAEATRGPVAVTLAPPLRARLQEARATVERAAAGPAPVYGLNTGLGANLGTRLDPAEIPAFQAQLLAGRTVAVGETLPEPVCRAALLARIVSLSRGVSGISPAILDLMIAMAAAGLAPAAPSRGSIGAGDLALAAQMGAALTGQGMVWREGALVPAASALAAAGLEPAALGPKDAIALANHSAVTVALSALALDRARAALDLAMGVAALSGEGYAMNPGVFDARVNALRPAAGQEAAAAWFRRALAGSSLLEPGAARAIQDALSFRVMAPVFGAARVALEAARTECAVELNAAAENPAVLPETGELISTPNFQTHALALALDALAVALAHVATGSAQRVVKLMAPQLSGLPRYLSPAGGAAAGFVPMQKTVAALVGEIRLAANPASLDAMPVSEMVEDMAPQTPLCARKLDGLLGALEWLVAIEAMVAAQAVDLRAPKALGSAASLLHATIRARVPPLGADRETGPDAEAARAALAAPEVAQALRAFDG